MPSAPVRPSRTPSKTALPRPLVLVDVVIFTLRDGRLEVLLMKRAAASGEPFADAWALPGGYVDTGLDADLAACARRTLRAKTGVDAPYLEQLGSWGNALRDPRGWSVTTVYFTLLSAADADLGAGGNAVDVGWCPIDSERVRPDLAFDHAVLLAAALQRLRSKVEYTSLPGYLVPAEFTLSELQHAYESVLGRPLEKSAFRTRVLSAGMVEPIDGVRAGPTRPAQLYRLARPAELVFFPRTFNPPRE